MIILDEITNGLERARNCANAALETTRDGFYFSALCSVDDAIAALQRVRKILNKLPVT